MPLTSTGTVNPTSTITVAQPDLRGGPVSSNAVDFTLTAGTSYTTAQLDTDCFPAVFAIAARNVTTAGNQAASGFIYMNSATSTPLVTSANAVVVGTPAADQLGITRSNRSLVITTLAGSATYAVRLTRIL